MSTSQRPPLTWHSFLRNLFRKDLLMSRLFLWKRLLDDIILANSSSWCHLYGEPDRLRHLRRELVSRVCELAKSSQNSIFSWIFFFFFFDLVTLRCWIMKQVLLSLLSNLFLDTCWNGVPNVSHTPKVPLVRRFWDVALPRSWGNECYRARGPMLLSSENGHLQSSDRVQTKLVDMADFKSKGFPAPKYGRRICQHLQDNYASDRRVSLGNCHHFANIIGDTSKVEFLYSIDVRYFTTVIRNMRFTSWLCDCLYNF